MMAIPTRSKSASELPGREEKTAVQARLLGLLARVGSHFPAPTLNHSLTLNHSRIWLPNTTCAIRRA